MVDRLDEEALNRIMGYLDLSKIHSEDEFWEEFWHQFKGKGSKKMGLKLKDHVEDEIDQELPRHPKERVIYHYKGTKFKREIMMRGGKHYTAHRDVKTGRFVSVK